MPVFDKLSSVLLNRRNLTRQRLLTTTALYKNSRSLLNPVNRLCVKLAWDWFQSRQKWCRAHTEKNGSKMAVILKSMRGGMYRVQELGVTQHLSLVNETDFKNFFLWKWSCRRGVLVFGVDSSLIAGDIIRSVAFPVWQFLFCVPFHLFSISTKGFLTG